MDRPGDVPTLLLRGTVCGALALLAALVTTWLLVGGPTPTGQPSSVAAILVDAHQPLASNSVRELPALTWFAIPPTVLYAVPPVLVASAGTVAGRLTTATALRIGLRAGLPVAIGYVPLLAAIVLWTGAEMTLLGPATAIALVCGAIGGVVGVRT